MSILKEIQALEELRWRGTLTDAEFEVARRNMLEQAQARVELLQLDREWESERESYIISGLLAEGLIPTRSISFRPVTLSICSAVFL